MNAAALNRDLEQIDVRQWLRDLGLPAEVSTVDFAVWCLEQEGLENVTEEFAETILWNCTGFPSFWAIGLDGDHPIECCATQLRGWAKVHKLSPEYGTLLLNDMQYSWRDFLPQLQAQANALTLSILEGD